MIMNAMRTLLGESLYEWSVQMGQMLDQVWSSLLVWRILALILLLVLLIRHYHRPA